jgi:hypothetical protein
MGCFRATCAPPPLPPPLPRHASALLPPRLGARARFRAAYGRERRASAPLRAYLRGSERGTAPIFLWILNHTTRQLSRQRVLDELCLYRKLVMFQSLTHSTELEQLFSWLHQCGNVLVQTLMLQLIEQGAWWFNLTQCSWGIAYTYASFHIVCNCMQKHVGNKRKCG